MHDDIAATVSRRAAARATQGGVRPPGGTGPSLRAYSAVSAAAASTRLCLGIAAAVLATVGLVTVFIASGGRTSAPYAGVSDGSPLDNGVLPTPCYRTYTHDRRRACGWR